MGRGRIVLGGGPWGLVWGRGFGVPRVRVCLEDGTTAFTRQKLLPDREIAHARAKRGAFDLLYTGTLCSRIAVERSVQRMWSRTAPPLLTLCERISISIHNSTAITLTYLYNLASRSLYHETVHKGGRGEFFV